MIYKVNDHAFGKNNKFVGSAEVDWMRYVTLQQTNGGVISADKLSGRKGEIINLSQTTSSQYRFDGYSLTGATLTSNKFAINDGDVTAQGIFTYYPTRSVTVTQQTGGTVAASPTTGHDGDVVTLSNTANSHYTFGSYSVTGATLTGNQFKFNGGNATAKGTFIADPIRTVTLQTTSGGTINANKLTGYDGDTITLTTATTAQHCHFGSYSITGATLTGNSFKLNGSNVTAKANYIPEMYLQTVTASGYLKQNETTDYTVRFPGNGTTWGATKGYVYGVITNSSNNFPSYLKRTQNISGTNYTIVTTSTNSNIKAYSVNGTASMNFIIPDPSDNTARKTSAHIGSKNMSTTNTANVTLTAYFTWGTNYNTDDFIGYYGCYNRDKDGYMRQITASLNNSTWSLSGAISAY